MKKIWDTYREPITYIIFGGLTTLINLLVYFPLTYFGIANYTIANIIAWIVAVLFAFVTNKLFVFQSKKTSSNKLLRELISFFSFRLFSLFAEMIIMYLAIDILGINDTITKLVTQVIVIVLNYIFSKLFVFNQKK